MGTKHQLLLCIGLLVWQCNATQDEATPLVITIGNPAGEARKDAFVTLHTDTLQRKIPGLNLSEIALFDDRRQVAFQTNDLDGDGQPEELALVVDLPANGEKELILRSRGEDSTAVEFPKRTQAELSHKTGGHWEDRKYIGGTFQNVKELRVPNEHTDHSFFIRYEGPGWESDLVGYRFYLDWRNATDIFGKKTTKMVLQDVGKDGFDSYYEPADWGMDVLKVGESLGIGTLGKWHEGKAEHIAITDSIFTEVVLNGPIASMIRTTYYGWDIASQKTDVTSELFITAGSRLTRHHVELSRNLDSLCTGIVKLDSTVLLQQMAGEWGYLATWGRQSLNDDSLGMAIIFNTADLLGTTEDEHSEVVVLQPVNNELTYYFLGAWEKEPSGITSQEEFEDYLNATLQEFNNPVTVSY
jgi:hypothetical protein